MTAPFPVRTFTQDRLTVSASHRGRYEITGDITAWLAGQTVTAGLLTLYLRHTSASLLIQENQDPDVLRDLEDFFGTQAPEDTALYRHTAPDPARSFSTSKANNGGACLIRKLRRQDKIMTHFDKAHAAPTIHSTYPAAISSCPEAPIVDPFGRTITYLRVSVTDRCDFRCVYCMSENMTFLPKAELLTLEELDRLCTAFVRRGVRKLRLTGGEPLVRRKVVWLLRRLGRLLESGELDELTLTTNGSQLSRYARDLYAAGVRRVNISLDTRDHEKFRKITRWGKLDNVLSGIDAAQEAGLKVKINAVALKGTNEHELPEMIEWAHGRGMDFTVIETMPLGDIDGDRTDQYLPLSLLRARLAERWTLEDIDYKTGGPARYVRIRETSGRLGFITPLTHNFCESCNRVRVTCTGTLYLCLGQDDAADLRAPLRASDDDLLMAAIDEAITRKPKGHDFVINRRTKTPAVARHMSVTGG